MFEALCQSFAMQKAIFGAIACGDFLLALLILLLATMRKERREARENAEIRKALTGFPPDAAEKPPEKRCRILTNMPEMPRVPEPSPNAETEEARRVRTAKEDAEAWRQMMNYSAADAYGGGEGG